MRPVARRGWYIVGLIVAVLVGVVFALACLGGVIGAAGSSSYRAHNGETFGGDMALAIISAVIVVGSIGVGTHLEHQLRRHHPVVQSWSGTAPPLPESRSWPVHAGRARKTRYSPLALGIYFLLLLGLAIGMAIGAVSTHADGQRSARVQHRGIPRMATVLRVQDHYHSRRGGGYYTADITASINQVVDGRNRTVVHYPGRVQEAVGEQVQILVDPENPGYAEFSGSPGTNSWAWIPLAVFAVFFAGIDALAALAFLRLRRHRRSFNAVAVPPPARSP